jgi:hypothetical protein
LGLPAASDGRGELRNRRVTHLDGHQCWLRLFLCPFAKEPGSRPMLLTKKPKRQVSICSRKSYRCRHTPGAGDAAHELDSRRSWQSSGHYK